MNLNSIEQRLSAYESANRQPIRTYRAPGHTPVIMDWIMPDTQFCEACSAGAKTRSAVHWPCPYTNEHKEMK